MRSDINTEGQTKQNNNATISNIQNNYTQLKMLMEQVKHALKVELTCI